ncbi:MAG: choice-of-anchor Q domain-containing protein, partial [Candidatus Electrothrix sp.]
CVDGFEDDTIILETDILLGEGEDARPPITTSVTIEGQGHIINGNGGIGYVLKISRGINEDDYCVGGDLTLNNATITGGNHAHPGDVTSGMLNNGGGITNACFGTVTLNNTTVSGNTALGNGGGIFTAPWSVLTLNNSTISGNTAEGNGGGGIYSDNAVVTLNSSTVSENITAGGGGGICGVTIYGPWFTINAVRLNNSIISGNTASSGNELYLGESFINADNSNLFGDSGESDAEAFVNFVPEASDVNATSDGTSGILISTALPDILNPLADNGGLTMTHALVKGSPAIDQDKTCSTGFSEDQRGEPRPVGKGCDAGSFEFANHIPVADAGENQEEVIAGDLVCLDGSASYDVDGDLLSYSWEFTAWPAGSIAELDDSTAEAPCFTADLSGTYQVSLVVNDGIENSEPSTTEVVAISLSEAVIATIEETVLVTSSLDPDIFDNENKQGALINQINAAIALIDEGLYAEALDKLENSILGKTDGCVESGAPDKNDWIEDCASQEELYDLIQETISILEELM